MKKRFYDYDVLCGAMHDVILGNGAKHRCIDAGMILGLPQADVVERKKGKWIPYSKVYECRYNCSLCGYDLMGIHESEANFCPNCGADMRGEKTDE